MLLSVDIFKTGNQLYEYMYICRVATLLSITLNYFVDLNQLWNFLYF